MTMAGMETSGPANMDVTEMSRADVEVWYLQFDGCVRVLFLFRRQASAGHSFAKFFHAPSM